MGSSLLRTLLNSPSLVHIYSKGLNYALHQLTLSRINFMPFDMEEA